MLARKLARRLPPVMESLRNQPTDASIGIGHGALRIRSRVASGLGERFTQ